MSLYQIKRQAFYGLTTGPSFNWSQFFSQHYRPRNALLQATLVIGSFYKAKTGRNDFIVHIMSEMV